MGIIKWPFGYATKLAPAAAATHDIEIENNKTFISLTGLAQATTVNLTADVELEAGAEVIIDVVQGGTGRNVTLGDNIVAPDLTGVANDRDKITLVWNGTAGVGGSWDKVIDAA